MLDAILKKIGFKSVEDYINHENELVIMSKGTEADWPDVLLLLSREERHFLQRYVNEKGLA